MNIFPSDYENCLNTVLNNNTSHSTAAMVHQLNITEILNKMQVVELVSCNKTQERATFKIKGLSVKGCLVEAITVDELIRAGSFNDVYVGAMLFEDKSSPLHIAVRVSKAGTNEEKLIRDVFVHIALQCHFYNVVEPRYEFGKTFSESPIPAVYFSGLLPLKNSPRTITLMQPLHIDLYDFIGRGDDVDDECLLEVLCQTMKKLQDLSRSIQFVHKDFHPGNIMLDPRHAREEAVYEDVKLTSEYRVYFIDMQSCVFRGFPNKSGMAAPRKNEIDLCTLAAYIEESEVLKGELKKREAVPKHAGHQNKAKAHGQRSIVSNWLEKIMEKVRKIVGTTLKLDGEQQTWQVLQRLYDNQDSDHELKGVTPETGLKWLLHMIRAATPVSQIRCPDCKMCVEKKKNMEEIKSQLKQDQVDLSRRMTRPRFRLRSEELVRGAKSEPVIRERIDITEENFTKCKHSRLNTGCIFKYYIARSKKSQKKNKNKNKTKGRNDKSENSKKIKNKNKNKNKKTSTNATFKN